MANNNPQLDYTTIPNPYPRSDGSSTGANVVNQAEGGRTILSGEALTDAWIDTWIKSTGYEPKKRGFLIDGQKGYIECMKLWVGPGGVIGGSLDIPDNVNPLSFHVDALGNTWWGSATLAGSVASVLNTGVGTFSDITITGGSVATSTFNGIIDQTNLNVSDRGWNQTCVFSSTNLNTVSWLLGDFTSADGTIYHITAGSTGVMTGKVYIYFRPGSGAGESDTTYQKTTNSSVSVGAGKVLIAVAQNDAVSATFALTETTQIVGDNILANTINASKIMTGQLIVGTNVGIGTAQDGINSALAAAANAQETADGQLTGFYQNTAPVAGMYYGDIWIDTNGATPLDSTCIYRYQDGAGGYTDGSMSWVNTPTNSIGLAYLNAYDAQTTADGKIVSFYANDPPTAEGVGDLWVDTNDSNKLYRWSGAAWVTVRDGGIAQAISDAATAISNAATAQGTADGKVTTFFQNDAPTAEGIGDLWIDTNDGNKLYRWSGAAWTAVQDASIGQAISDAADAQSTADGKIVSFYQNNPPTAMATGDLWTDTNDSNKLYRWSGASWVSIRDTQIATSASGLSSLISSMGSLAYLNLVQEAQLGNTVIINGHIATSLLTANDILGGSITGNLVQTSPTLKSGVKMSNGLGGIVIYDQSLFIKNGNDDTIGYLYPNFTNSPQNSGSNWRLGLVNYSGIDTLIGAGTNIILSSQFVIPTEDNTMYLGASTTLVGGDRDYDWTWKYIGGQVIDAKADYRINGIVCIDQAASNVYFCGGGSLYMQGTVGTNDIKCTYDAVTIYHDTEVQGTLTSTSDRIILQNRAYFGTTGAYNAAKYYLRSA